MAIGRSQGSCCAVEAKEATGRRMMMVKESLRNEPKEHKHGMTAGFALLLRSPDLSQFGGCAGSSAKRYQPLINQSCLKKRYFFYFETSPAIFRLPSQSRAAAR